MTSSFDSIFLNACKDLKADEKLAGKIHNYVVGFINKNDQHSQFFGGNLLGVQVVRFTENDKNKWFDDILDADEFSLTQEIGKLKCVQGKEGVFHVAGDALNQSCLWLVHQYWKSHLSDSARRAAMVDILTVLQIKFLTSRLYRLFRYPADRSTAEATYAALSNKYLIKTEGSWIKVLEARSLDIISENSLHYETIKKFDSDAAIVYMVNDIQGRIRDMLKNIYQVFLDVHKAGSRITSSSSTLEWDGEEVLKERTKGLEGYTRYLKSVVSDRNSFIRPELVSVVNEVMKTAPPKQILLALEYVSSNYLKTASDEVSELIDQTLIHSFGYFAANRSSMRSNIDLNALLIRLRGVYTSSRSTDPDLIELRHLAESVVSKALSTKTASIIAAVRTALLLYLVARACTMKHYSGVSMLSSRITPG